MDLIAYRIPDLPAMELVPAPASRTWMEGTDHARLAQLCLPLRIGNQLGWHLLNAEGFRARWDGRSGLHGVEIWPLGGGPLAGFSAFGNGHVGFVAPYVFRTPPGWSLLVKGPSNLYKRGASPIEAVVETDHATSTFHVAWRITLQNYWVEFPAGEAVAQIMPFRIDDAEAFRPAIRNLDDDADIAAGYRRWRAERVALIDRIGKRIPAPGEASRDYIRTARKRKVVVCPFDRASDADHK